ncbi:MAG TPA: site-specific integrase [Pseudolabrys sp.]|nr:site-specific integrase [Pseudolabrys sp.]
MVRGKLRTARQIEGRMNRALSSLFARPAADVQRRDLRKILDAVADRGAPREAEKQRQVVSRLFRWALSRDLVDVDPSAGLASYGAGAPRDRVLEAAEIKTLWQWLDELPADYAEALRVQLAIGARIGEVAGIHAAEVDQEKWLWTLPAARSKNNRPRVTPLVGVARKIVAERLSLFGRGPLFIAEKGKQLSSQSVASMLIARRPTCPVAHFTTHDMRRTVATRMVDLGIGLELVAAVLGHEAGGANVRTLTRHYIRTDLIDRKRVALEAWNARLIQIVEGGAVMENILPLTARGG